MRPITSLILFMSFAVIFPTTLYADDVATCRAASGDEAIVACSRLIDSGWYSGQAAAVIYNNRGKALIDLGENDRALHDLNEALQLDPNLAVAFSNRGLVWLDAKKYDRSIQDFNEAIQLDPSLGVAYKNRAVAWLATKKYDDAISGFDKVMQLTTSPSADDYLGRGAAWIGKKNYDKALPDLDNAIRIDPRFAIAFNDRGFVYNNKGEFDRAISDLNNAIHLDPNLAVSYKNRGISYERKGETDKALADFKKAIKLDPHNKEAADGISRNQKTAAAQLPKENVLETPVPPDDHAKMMDTNAQTDTEKAALAKVMKDAVAAHHGGVLPKTMSQSDLAVSIKAALKWKSKQATEQAKRELEAMKIKPVPTDGSADIYVAKEAIRSALRDPDSAVFGDNVFYANDRKLNGYYVPVVCGSVNARNGFGGMTGQKKFVFFPTLDGRLALEGSVSDAVIVEYWNKMCSGTHN